MFMFALAVLFLTGSLGIIGWMFRSQVMTLVHQVYPGLASESTAVAGTDPTPAPDSPPALPDIPEKATTAETPATPAQTPQEATSPPSMPSMAFDPSEEMPRRAIPATSEEIASTVRENPTREGMTGSVAIPPPDFSPTVPDSGPKDLPGTEPLDEKEMLEVMTPGSTAIAERNLSSQRDGPFTAIKDLEPEAMPAAEAPRAFLEAADVQERLAHTLGADAMAPLMERYYSRTADGPVIVDTVQFVRYDPEPQVGAGAHAVFGLGSPTWEYPIPVMLEETKEGWRVDWLAFVEFKDRLLEKFLDKYQEGPARFHVGISRTHFFDDSLPNADSRDAFRVGPAPPNPFLHTIFLSKDSPLATKLKRDISWGSQVWAIVELQWRRMGNDKWVELVAVPQLNWYSVPAIQAAGPAPIPPEDSGASTSEDIPRALPAGR